MMKRQQAISKNGSSKQTMISRSGDGLHHRGATQHNYDVQATNGTTNATENSPSVRNNVQKTSPMERVEIVFGNLTNMELLSGKASPSSSVQKTTKSSEINQNDFCAPKMRKAIEQIELKNKKNKVNNENVESTKSYTNSVKSKYGRASAGGGSVGVAKTATTNGNKNFGQLSTQKLDNAGNTRCFLTSRPEQQSHCRSKTMPEIKNNCYNKGIATPGVTISASYSLPGQKQLIEDEYETSTQVQLVQQLRQDNMILAAEKSSLQAELIFYKNELAKMCLRNGSTFPIFRQPDTVSSLATNQILGQNSATSNSYLVQRSSKPVIAFCPLSSKPQSIASEDRYVCVSQGDCPEEELVSTNGSGAMQTISQDQKESLDLSQAKSQIAIEPEDLECPTTVKRERKVNYENLAPQSIQIGAESSLKSSSTQQLSQKRRSVDEVATKDRTSLQRADSSCETHEERSVTEDQSLLTRMEPTGTGGKLSSTAITHEKINCTSGETTMNNSFTAVSPKITSKQPSKEAKKPQFGVQAATNKVKTRASAMAATTSGGSSTTPISNLQQLTVNLSSMRSSSNLNYSRYGANRINTVNRVSKQSQRRKRSERNGSRRSSNQSKKTTTQGSSPRSQITTEAEIEHPAQMYQTNLYQPASVRNGSNDKDLSVGSKASATAAANSARESSAHSSVKTLEMEKCVAVNLPLAAGNQKSSLTSRDLPYNRQVQTIQASETVNDSPNPYQDNNVASDTNSLTPSNIISHQRNHTFSTQRTVVNLGSSSCSSFQQQPHPQPGYHSSKTADCAITNKSDPITCRSDTHTEQLDEREKMLESSHRELQQKLAKVRQELQQLSEMQSNHSGAESRSAFDDDRTVEQNCSPETRQQEFEDEIQKLRQQLVSFNEEEKKVMRELELTRTMRQTALKVLQMQNPDIALSESEESFQLLPQQLNFDGCSQRTIGMLQSPMPGTLNLNLNFDITQETQLHLQNMNRTPDSTEDVCALSSYRSANLEKDTSVSEPAVTARECDEAQDGEILKNYVQSEAQAPLNIDLKCLVDDQATNSIFVNKASNKPQYMATSVNSLWINQIIEEEHESESNAENSANHSRCASNQQTNNDTIDKGSKQQESNLSCANGEILPEAHILQKLNEQLQRIAVERKSFGASTDYAGGQLEDHLGDIRLFNNVPGYDVDSSIGDKSPSDTLTSNSFLKSTQRNKDILLQRINDNLDKLQLSDSSSRKSGQQKKITLVYSSIDTQPDEKSQKQDSSDSNLSKSLDSNKVPSIESLTGNQIQILHQENSGIGTSTQQATLKQSMEIDFKGMEQQQNNEFASVNSIEKLSKASPCFQEHSTFELTTRQMGETIKSCLQMSQGSIHRVGQVREHSFMEQQSSGSGLVSASINTGNCLNIEKQQRSMFDHEMQKVYSSVESYGVEIDCNMDSQQSIKAVDKTKTSNMTGLNNENMTTAIDERDDIVDISDSRVTFARKSCDGVLQFSQDYMRSSKAQSQSTQNDSSQETYSKITQSCQKASTSTYPQILSKSQVNLPTTTNINQTSACQQQPRQISPSILTQNRIMSNFTTLRSGGAATQTNNSLAHSKSLQLMRPIRQQTPTYPSTSLSSQRTTNNTEQNFVRSQYNPYKRSLYNRSATSGSMTGSKVMTTTTSQMSETQSQDIEKASPIETVKNQPKNESVGSVRNKYPNSRKYESSYEDYINDSNTVLIPAQRINLITTQSVSNTSVKNTSAGLSQTPNNASTAVNNMSTPQTNQATLAKTKSYTSLSSQINGSFAQRPSPGLYRRNNETNLSGIAHSSSTKIIKNNQAFNQSQMTASRSERQIQLLQQLSGSSTINSGILSSNKPTPYARTISITKPGGSMQTLPPSESTVNSNGAARSQGAVHHRTNTAATSFTACSDSNSKNVVLFSDAKSSSSAINTGNIISNGMIQQTSTTMPGYMQPIHQKFRKQTIKMINEKEAELTAAPRTSTLRHENNTNSITSAMVKQYRLYQRPGSISKSNSTIQ